MTTPAALDHQKFLFASLTRKFFQILPGILLSAAVAWVGIISSEWIGKELLGFDKSPVSGIMMAIVIGLIVSNIIRLPVWTKSGIQFSLKIFLRMGIILLGIRLGLGDVLRLGIVGIPLILFCLAGAILVTRWLGNYLGLSPRLSVLIAVGTSICGATAIVATGPAIEAREEELTYAIANITVFGIVAMFLYPYIGNLLFNGAHTEIGLFLGTSIHETAQVAGSGLISAQLFDAPRILDVATVTKLVRNLFMIAVIPLMAYSYRRQSVSNASDEKQKIRFMDLFPTFILGFILFAVIRTIGDATLDSGSSAWGLWDAQQWASLTNRIRTAAEALLTIAMAGVGLGTNFQQLRGLGLKPFYVGLTAAVVVGVISIIGIIVLQQLVGFTV